MAEYIDRQKAIDAIKRLDQQKLYLPIDFREMLESIPPADVRPVVRGKWEERIVEDKQHDPYGLLRRRWYCSECGRWQTHGETKFCPNCGADMRGGYADG